MNKVTKLTVGVVAGLLLVTGCQSSENEVTKQDLQQLQQVMKMNVSQTKASLSAMSQLVKEQKESQLVYTVTSERSDGYVKTVNGQGQNCFLSDVEMNLMELQEGDQVKILLNEFGEVVSVEGVNP
ncbi:hypothetical protein QUF73_24885 [Cytobacillus sp. NJ13]|nr:hypothetical protein [Cytobacillus sp. NJ13]